MILQEISTSMEIRSFEPKQPLTATHLSLLSLALYPFGNTVVHFFREPEIINTTIKFYSMLVLIDETLIMFGYDSYKDPIYSVVEINIPDSNTYYIGLKYSKPSKFTNNPQTKFVLSDKPYDPVNLSNNDYDLYICRIDNYVITDIATPISKLLYNKT